MKQVGDYKILAHREAVWDALNDPIYWARAYWVANLSN